MNRPAPDFLTTEENSAINNDINNMVDDSTIGASITYKAFLSRAYTPETGTDVVTYTNTTLNAITGNISTKEIEQSGGQMQRGDKWFWFPLVDMSSTLTKEDVIVSGSVTYQVIEWKEDTLGKMYRVVVRKM